MNTLVWESLGEVPPRRLAEARLLLHHAAQLVAAVGRCLVAPRPDDGHTSLEWRAGARALAGQEVPGPRPWRAALRVDDLSLAVCVRDAEVSRLALPGRTQADAFAWLAERARDLGAASERLRLAAPYAIPEHPVGGGAPFAPGSDGSLAELARWVADGTGLVRAVADTWPAASPVRVWPHHFDVGSVLPLDGQGKDAPSIGVGLSLGDEGMPEPYLYVTPWPRPAGESLPELPAGGRWHREGWTGAVLTGSEIVDAGEGAAAQAAEARAFLSGTVEVLRAWYLRRAS